MACSKLEARGHLLHKTGTPPTNKSAGSVVAKAELLFFVHKKLEIEKAKPTFIICISFESCILDGFNF